MEIFLEIHGADDKGFLVPLPSAVIVFILKYCRTSSVKVTLVTVSGRKTGDTSVRLKRSTLEGVDYTVIEENVIPQKVQNCDLPVIQDEDGQMIRSGLCSCVRHIVSYSSLSTGNTTTLDLLGFRHGSLKACAEVSGWTKLCEIELPRSICQMMSIIRTLKHQQILEIPPDVMKLELYLERPPPLHNDDKKKRALLKKVKKELPPLDEVDVKCDKVCSDIFRVREEFLPHGNSYYRVITKSEKEAKKFENQSCKFGCTENRLVKGCAKCNDREKDRQKEIQMSKNNLRKNQTNHSNEVIETVVQNGIIRDGNELIDKSHGISTVEDLCIYVDSLTLYDIEYDHTYVEGVIFTIADIMLFVYFYHLMESQRFQCKALFQQTPFIHKWLKHLIILPGIQDTALMCGYDLNQLKSCVNHPRGDAENTQFTIPDGVLNVEEENEIMRRSKGKVRPLKSEIAKVLEKIEDKGILPNRGSHPRGIHVQVDWDSLPREANPAVELPEKRVKRKCEQLENLVTAVEEVCKPGDVIVDFCSGSGHLGIIIAYLLPDCTVYMVENNEESLKRATDRVKALKLSNVVLYQSNLGYFKGHFDVGVCLHACGVATDMVLQQCIDNKASFVICPCCYGSILNTHLISYPRSNYFRDAAFTDKDVILLGHAADQTEVNIDLQSQGQHCMNLVDTDRANLAKENGYTVTLCSLQPLTCTPKNNLLIGTAPAR